MFDGLFIIDRIDTENDLIKYKRGVILGFLFIILFFMGFIIAFGLVEKEKSDVALGLSVTVIVLLVTGLVYFIFIHKVRPKDTVDEKFLGYLKDPKRNVKINNLEFWSFVLLFLLSLFGVISVGIVKYFDGNQDWIDAISILTVSLASLLLVYIIFHMRKGDKKIDLSDAEKDLLNKSKNLSKKYHIDRDTIDRLNTEKNNQRDQEKREQEGGIFASEEQRRDIEEGVRTGEYPIVGKSLPGGYVRAGPNTVGVVSGRGPGRKIDWVNRGEDNFENIKEAIYRLTDNKTDEPLYPYED